MYRQPDLLEIAFALCSSRSLASLLYRRQQQRNQYRNDGDDNQQLNQGPKPRSGLKLATIRFRWMKNI